MRLVPPKLSLLLQLVFVSNIYFSFCSINDSVVSVPRVRISLLHKSPSVNSSGGERADSTPADLPPALPSPVDSSGASISPLKILIGKRHQAPIPAFRRPSVGAAPSVDIDAAARANARAEYVLRDVPVRNFQPC